MPWIEAGRRMAALTPQAEMAVRVALLCGLFIAIGVIFYRFRTRFKIIGEFLLFLKERKLWWMAPIIIVFVILSILIVVTEKSAVLAVIYPFF